MFRDYKKYEIFDDGRIWSYSHNKWIKPQINQKGYFRVHLSDNNNNIKSYLLHRVVYEACTQQPIPEGFDINHINENKIDNRFENLNLMTHKENINFGTHNERVSKGNTNNPIISKQVAQYDLEGNLINVFPSTSEVQRQLGFETSGISRCCNGKNKSSYGFIWKYITENPS